MKKLLRILLISISLVLLLVFGTSYWALYTNSGLRTVLSWTGPLLKQQGIKLNYTGLQGSIQNLRADAINIRQGSSHITVQHARLAWQPWQLLTGHLVITKVQAQTVAVKVSPSSLPTNQHRQSKPVNYDPGKLLKWLSQVRVQHVAIKQYEAYWPGGQVLGTISWQLANQSWQVTAHATADDASADGGGYIFNFNSQSDGSSSKTEGLLTGDMVSGELHSAGSYQDHGWHNTIKHLQFTTPYGKWRLTNDYGWHLGADGLVMSDLCLHHRQQQVCLNLAINAKEQSLHLHSDHLDLSQWQNDTPLESLQGQASFNLQLEHDNKNISAHLQAMAHNITLRPSNTIQAFQDKANIHIDRISWTGSLLNKTLTSDLEVAVAPNNSAHLGVKIQKIWQPAQSKITGKVVSDLHDISLFDYLSPDLNQLSGSILGQLTVAGTMAQPRFSGQLQLANAKANLPLLGIHVDRTNISLTGKKARLLAAGSAHSGKGQLHLAGQAGSVFIHPHIKAKITGQDFEISNTPTAELMVTPDITYQQSSKASSLSGSVTVTNAKINGDLLHRAPQGSSDIVYVNDQGEPIAEQKVLPFNVDVEFHIKSDASFTGFGITTKAQGKINITGRAGQVTRASGQLQLVDGHYQFHGKDFIITQGALTYSASPLDDPALDVTAMYKMPPSGYKGLDKQLEIGAKVTGTINNPKIDLFSKPAISQEDILSYIVLGKPFTKAEGDGQAILAQAALMLASRGGSNNLLSNIQNAFGINQLSFGTLGADQAASLDDDSPNKGEREGGSSTDNTAIFIGKSLTPRLNISYGMGLFNNQREVVTTYQLSHHLQLTASAGNNKSGADLLYTIDQ